MYATIQMIFLACKQALGSLKAGMINIMHSYKYTIKSKQNRIIENIKKTE